MTKAECIYYGILLAITFSAIGLATYNFFHPQTLAQGIDPMWMR